MDGVINYLRGTVYVRSRPGVIVFEAFCTSRLDDADLISSLLIRLGRMSSRSLRSRKFASTGDKKSKRRKLKGKRKENGESKKITKSHRKQIAPSVMADYPIYDAITPF